MRTLATAAVVGLGLLAGTAATGHAQYYNNYGTPYYNNYRTPYYNNYGTPYYNNYGTPNTYSWSPYNYPGYQISTSGNPWYYSYPGYGYAYNYPTYNYYAGSPFPAPKAYWDPYVATRPYSDNAGPKASGHGSP